MTMMLYWDLQIIIGMNDNCYALYILFKVPKKIMWCN